MSEYEHVSQWDQEICRKILRVIRRFTAIDQPQIWFLIAPPFILVTQLCWHVFTITRLDGLLFALFLTWLHQLICCRLPTSLHILYALVPTYCTDGHRCLQCDTASTAVSFTTKYPLTKCVPSPLPCASHPRVRYIDRTYCHLASGWCAFTIIYETIWPHKCCLSPIFVCQCAACHCLLAPATRHFLMFTLQQTKPHLDKPGIFALFFLANISILALIVIWLYI